MASLTAPKHSRASRKASNSSIEEDTKISGCNYTSPNQVPLTSNLVPSSSGKTKRPISKHENVENIGLISGASQVDPSKHDTSRSNITITSIGVQDDQVYRNFLPKPISWIRDVLVGILRKETSFHARHQKLVRRPWLDRYFVNTSLLGTHSFFLIFLPMVFWLGNPRFGRGLVNVLAFGVYLSSALKDLLCVPRPYSPPVTRLIVGTHHLEYGFPSTHSTNSVSIAFYMYLWIRALRQSPYSIESTAWEPILASVWWEVGLLFYVGSVVYGRIYTGMHSMSDCLFGSALGVWISSIQWYFFDSIEDFICFGGIKVPLVIVPVSLLMVSVHPQPVDDCPCFEDAIAFISVAMGVTLARWFGLQQGFQAVNDNPLLPNTDFKLSAQRILPDLSLVTSFVEPVLNAVKQPVEALSSIDPTSVKLIKSVLLLTIGVANILLLRVVVKTTCNVVLPPIFRFFDEWIGFTLPRRHYTPASDYSNIPLSGLTAVPSLIDLPSTFVITDEDGNQTNLSEMPSPTIAKSGDLQPLQTTSTQIRNRRHHHSGILETTPSPTGSLFRPASPSPLHSPIPSRTPSPIPFKAKKQTIQTLPTKRIQFVVGDPVSEGDMDQSNLSILSKAQSSQDAPDQKAARKFADEVKAMSANEMGNKVKHYDADVLTKVIVYSSIGFVAAGLLPPFFEKLGLY